MSEVRRHRRRRPGGEARPVRAVLGLLSLPRLRLHQEGWTASACATRIRGLLPDLRPWPPADQEGAPDGVAVLGLLALPKLPLHDLARADRDPLDGTARPPCVWPAVLRLTLPGSPIPLESGWPEANPTRARWRCHRRLDRAARAAQQAAVGPAEPQGVRSPGPAPAAFAGPDDRRACSRFIAGQGSGRALPAGARGARLIPKHRSFISDRPRRVSRLGLGEWP